MGEQDLEVTLRFPREIHQKLLGGVISHPFEYAPKD